MAKKKMNYDIVRTSIRDLTRIYKPKPSQARSFVESFVKKYGIQKGYENELTAIVLEEIKKIKQEVH